MDIEPAAIADWLLRTTWQVAVLVAVVGAVHLLVGRRLAPRWRFALWGLVVVRLLLPVIPASPWSVFNLSPGVMIAAGPHASSEGTPALAAGPFGGSPGVVAPVEPQDPDAAALPKQPLDLGDAAPDRKASPVAVPPAPRLVDATQSASVATSALRPPDEGRPFDWRFALLLAWLAGAAFVAARVVIGTEVLRRKLRTATAPDGDVLALLDRCRREMDVTGPLPALVTDAVAGPALFGFARPRLLLPPALLRELSRADLRFVFLHELAHLKRRDPLTNAALLVAGAMHWFNPLARLALARCRAERELACDELVMQATAPDACPAYGRVVLRVAETLCAARVRGPVGAGGAASLVLAAAPAIGLIPSRSQLRRRIAMIATFRHAPRRRYRQAILPALLLLGVCSCALTDRSDDPADPPAPTVTPPTTTAPTTQPADAAAWVRTLPVDGEVVGPAKDGENVLINLGTGDQISPGLRFEVYDRAAGIPPLPTGPETAEAGDGRAGLGKASLEVVRVGRTQSECRIVRQRGPAAVVAGDVIGNVVYDKNARPVFVVAGTFHEDLVRRIIQQYGGRVTDEAGAAGDFVLLGAPPDAADGPARAAYGDARRRAAELGAPLLVEGHFLNYAGHNEDREKALADLMRTSRRRVAEARHDEALRVIDQILALDPGNEYAVGVRPLVLDKVHLRARRERAEAAGRDEVADGGPSERVRRAILERVIPDLTCDSVGLADVLDFLRDVTNLNLHTDWKLLEAEGVKRDTPITVRARNVSFERALRIVLDEAGGGKVALHFMFDDNVLRISTAEDIARRQPIITRVYDIRDLTTEVRNYTDAPKLGVAPMKDRDVAAAPALSDAARERKARTELVEEITTLIKETVDPDSWRDNGGSVGLIRELQGQLIVSQTGENQRGVVSLLEQLRETRSIQVMVEARFLTLDLDALPEPVREKVRQSFDRPGEPGACALTEAEVTAVLAGAKKGERHETAGAPRITLYNGQRAYVQLTEDRPYVSGYAAVTEGGKTQYEPRHGIVTSGMVLDVAATASADRKHVTLTLRPQIARLEGMTTAPFDGKGDGAVEGGAAAKDLTVQVPHVIEQSLQTTASVPDRGVLLLGGFVQRSAPPPPAGAGAGAEAEGAAAATQPVRDLYLLVKPTLISPQPPPPEPFPLISK